MGTPGLAVPPLQALAAEHDIALVVTQPDKPAGRSKQPVASPVKEWAVQNGVPVSQPTRARGDEFIASLEALAPDAIAVVAFGQILPRRVLELAPFGCVNLHYSLLPRWRGAAPVQHALLNGDKVTGVTTQWMAEKLDAGDVIVRREVEILPGETTADLWERLTPIGSDVLSETMRQLASGEAGREPQDEALVTMAPTLKREDGLIDWSQPAESIVNRVRAMNPWPVAWCPFRGGVLKVWRAEASGERGAGQPGTITGTGDSIRIATGQGEAELLEVQAEGRPRLPAKDWARGARLEAGQPLAG